MNPERQCSINGFRIEEFYWAGDYIVYVNHGLVDGSYENACAIAEKNAPPRYVKR